MGAKSLIRHLIEASGFTIQRLPSSPPHPDSGAPTDEAVIVPPPEEEATQDSTDAVAEGFPDAYDEDGLRSFHNHDFMQDPDFRRAYERGCQAAHDYGWHWRVHIGLWAAFSASKLNGDFVECGVNRGFLSSAIMAHLNWDALGKTFYLLDTFEGIDPLYCSEADIKAGAIEKNNKALADGFYVKNVDSVRENFSEWHNISIIEGSIPETLDQVKADQIAFLHIDMNCSPPEIAALTYFWDRLVPGAIILLDDYAYIGFEPQKQAMDAFARQHNLQIASLPTGQGLLLRPPTISQG